MTTWNYPSRNASGFSNISRNVSSFSSPVRVTTTWNYPDRGDKISTGEFDVGLFDTAVFDAVVGTAFSTYTNPNRNISVYSSPLRN